MLTEKQMIESFEALSFPIVEFGHQAHVYLAWCYLRNYPLPEAMLHFRDSLKRYATHHNASANYHETITMIYLLLIHDRMVSGDSWEDFRKRNLDLIARGKESLARLYGARELESPEARSKFLLPSILRG